MPYPDICLLISKYMFKIFLLGFFGFRIIYQLPVEEATTVISYITPHTYTHELLFSFLLDKIIL